MESLIDDHLDMVAKTRSRLLPEHSTFLLVKQPATARLLKSLESKAWRILQQP